MTPDDFQAPIIVAVVAVAALIGGVIGHFFSMWPVGVVAAAMVVGSFVPVRIHRKDSRH